MNIQIYKKLAKNITKMYNKKLNKIYYGSPKIYNA